MIVKRSGGAVLRQLRTLYNLGTIGELTDGQLLERFATDPDELAELAFSALVERHGALVWRVCLAILRDEHDAEDAFQATFLVLVRKARSLWVEDSLGPWLHQVACRTASCLRATVIRRRRYDRRCAERGQSRTGMVVASRDPERDAAIHEEMDRLPEKYRAPLVLCDLEGRTHREAARCLGWPIGTVKSRQSQGRILLRDRLTRRGVGLALTAFVVEAPRPSALAGIPTALSRTTANVAMQQAGRLSAGFVISSQVLVLTQGVLRIMFWIKLRSLTFAAVLIGITSGGASLCVWGAQETATRDGGPGSQPRATAPPKTSQPKIPEKATGRPTPDEIRAARRSVRKAKVSYEIARLTRELAEIAVEEYDETIYPRDLASVDGEIKLAESDMTRANDRLDWARRMLEKGYVSTAQKVSEELTVKKAQFNLEQAQSRRKVLVEYTRAKTLKQLRGDVEKAHSDENARWQAWKWQEDQAAERERQLRLSEH